MNVEISTVKKVTEAPNFAALIAEYAVESASLDLPPASPDLLQYRKLEAAGVYKVVSAVTEDGELVGFMSVISSPMVHYSKVISVSESLFVAKAHRASTAGLKLIAAAQDLAAKAGSPVLYITAPVDSKLSKLLPKLGYVAKNIIFSRRVGQ